MCLAVRSFYLGVGAYILFLLNIEEVSCHFLVVTIFTYMPHR